MPQNRKSNAAARSKKSGGAKGKARQRKTSRGRAAAAPVVEDSAKNDIVGVCLAVVSIAMLISLVAPSTATLTHATERALTLCFGIGAALCPVALFLFSLTFFMDNQAPVSKRVAGGLALIVLAILSMISLNVAGAADAPRMVVEGATAEGAGGYVGGLVAWALLELVGRSVGNALLVGIIIVGVIVCGFSVSGFVGKMHEAYVQRRDQRILEREARAAEQEEARQEYEAAVRELEENGGQAVDAAETSFIGARKTSVLSRRKASVVGAAGPTDDVKTQLVRKRHPDLDVESAQPAGFAVTAAGQAADDAAKSEDAAAGQRTHRLKRKPHPRTGKADSVEEPQAQKAPTAEAIPDFLRNPAAAAASASTAPAKGAAGRPMRPKPATAAGRRGASASAAATAASQAPAKGVVPARDAKRPGDGDEGYELPPLSMLSSNPNSGGTADSKAELDATMADLQNTLEEFGLRSRVVDYISGPLVTTFRIEMGEGERVSKIKNLEDDIALTLAAEKVRIFAPIRGTSFVGIEIPNKSRENVHLGDVLPYAKGGPLEVAIGRDSAGKPVVADLAKMPHMLVAGTTGSGKSVMINSMIMSILMRTTPKQVRLIMVDPKRVEFSSYNGLPHLYVPVVTEPRQAASALQWAVAEMERRLKVFERAGARNLKVYNKMCVSGKLSEMDNPPEPMPYLVIIIDELSDLMMVAGKDVEASIVRIAQLARAAGIHLVIATQRPSANVVTGLIKSNIDTRAALKVSSGIDSRVILDETGAERLLGNGDMLFKNRGLTPQRVLGCYTSDNEINSVVEFIRDQAEPDYHEEILTAVQPNTPGGGGHGDADDEDDPLVWEAAQIVVDSQLGSTSGLQRRLKVGYARAGRIMDMLEAKGVVGPPDGSKPREVLLDSDGLEELRTQEAKYREVV